MNDLSRRAFMQMMGVSVAGALLPAAFVLSGPDEKEAAFGRALVAAPVLSWPDELAPAVRNLWPDSVIRFSLQRTGWLQLGDGYVPVRAIQPMPWIARYDGSEPRQTPSLIQVVGPVAVIRSWCAADAPLVARIGHGGVLHAVDYLPGEPHGWFGVDDGAGHLLGWTQVGPWRSVEDAHLPPARASRVVLSRAQRRLTLLQDDQVQLATVYAAGDSLEPGTYGINDRRPAVSFLEGEQIRRGIPWTVRFGGRLMIAGAYWHNEFGHAVSGPSVQLPPLVARWVYEQVNEETLIEVV